jgi:predicted metal-dependent phosphoesterase TrpH
MQPVIDLHTHTNESDGSLSVEELLLRAISLKIDVLAITDHDTLKGIIKAHEIVKNKNLPLKLVNGIEISCYCSQTQKIVHILGYFIDLENPILIEFVKILKKKRQQKNLWSLNSLKEKGIILKEDTFLRENLEKISRLNMAKALVKDQFAPTIEKAFEYLTIDSLELRDFFNKEGTSVKQAIEMIKEAGGISVIAHIKTLGKEGANLFEKLKALKQLGLDGVELFHPSHSKEFQMTLYPMIKELDFLYTAGSDFHGENKPERILGKSYNLITDFNEPYISKYLLDRINLL